jgi:SAM-dependent methyltransferase
LAHRLAQSGYHVLAVDASLDKDLGLQAAEVYRASVPDRLLPVQGNLEYPPLAHGKASLVILNASLHYADDLEMALQRSAAALQPSGSLLILDTPIARNPHPGTGKGDRHLGREEVERALSSAGLGSRWLSIPRNGRWWARQLKAWLKGDSLFTFPIVRACRAVTRQAREAEQRS